MARGPARRGWVPSALVGLLIAGIVGGCGTFRIGPGPAESSAAASAVAGAAGPTPTPKYNAPDDLAVGDCFDPIADWDDESLLAAVIHRCDEPHLAETIGTPVLPYDDSAEFPGSWVIDPESEGLCRVEFGRYIGVDFDESQLHASYYAPTQETWRGGDRGVLCLVEADDGATLTKSMKDSKR